MRRRVRLGLAGLGRIGRLHAENLFCEKPIALGAEPTVRAIRAATGAGIKLQASSST